MVVSTEVSKGGFSGAASKSAHGVRRALVAGIRNYPPIRIDSGLRRSVTPSATEEPTDIIYRTGSLLSAAMVSPFPRRQRFSLCAERYRYQHVAHIVTWNADITLSKPASPVNESAAVSVWDQRINTKKIEGGEQNEHEAADDIPMLIWGPGSIRNARESASGSAQKLLLYKVSAIDFLSCRLISCLIKIGNDLSCLLSRTPVSC